MPKVILKVGYNTYLLPDDTGVMAVVKALSRAVEVHDERIFKRGIMATSTDTLTVEVSYVAAKEKIRWPKEEKERGEDPEQLCLTEPTSIIIPPA